MPYNRIVKIQKLRYIKFKRKLLKILIYKINFYVNRQLKNHIILIKFH